MERTAAPPLLPILRSRQQAELLALLLEQPELELSLSELAERMEMAIPSVHREVGRAEQAGILTSRRVGNTRLVSADAESPYFTGLADILLKGFGVPRLIAGALTDVAGIERAMVFGSWAARYSGLVGKRPVGDIDVLILGEPDRDQLHSRIRPVEDRLGLPVQLTIRSANWLDEGTGSFHATVTGRPMVEVPVSSAAL